MRIRTISQAAIWLAIMGVFSPALALTQDELIAKIQAAGYSQVSDIKSTAEGISVKAMKDGKPYLEEVGEKDGKPVLRAATVVPALMKSCASCHGVKEGTVLGTIVYEVPIK